MFKLLGYFDDVQPTEEGLYSLASIYKSKDCTKEYWTPNRWLSQKRTKELFAAYGVQASNMVPKELAASYAMMLNSSFAVTFYSQLKNVDFWLS